MCPPLHYQAAEGEDASTVMAEWRGLYRLLRDELDVQVDLLEPRPDMPTLVLAASGGFVWEDSFIASRFREELKTTRSRSVGEFLSGAGLRHAEAPGRLLLRR